MTEPDERLRALLGADPPAGVLALGAAERAALADMADAALERQTTDLDASFDAMLKQVPFPVRKIAKKMLFG